MSRRVAPCSGLPRARSSRSMIASRTAPGRSAVAAWTAHVLDLMRLKQKWGLSPLLQSDFLLDDAPRAAFAHEYQLLLQRVDAELLRERHDAAIGAVRLDL